MYEGWINGEETDAISSWIAEACLSVLYTTFPYQFSCGNHLLLQQNWCHSFALIIACVPTSSLLL